jgi:hypothetical protein
VVIGNVMMGGCQRDGGLGWRERVGESDGIWAIGGMARRYHLVKHRINIITLVFLLYTFLAAMSRLKSLVRLLTNDLVRCVGPKHGHGSRWLCTCISMSKIVL